DFLQYYAARAARAERGEPRGVIVCISPWNFPLAIFTGQIAAALVTGNAVIAKPAEQTPLMASRAVQLMHEAGVPGEVLQLLPGPGETTGAALTADPRIGGVCFTGSTEVARLIERQLAETAPPDAMLIAETGGLNAMIVDSTALMEQSVLDILASAFQSAGQRCSALRMLYIQKDVEADLLEMLAGAMESLRVGDPRSLHTDIGPVIDAEARRAISEYVDWFEMGGDVVQQIPVPREGNFVAPTVLRVSGIGDLEKEVFGPVLHVAAFEADRIDSVVDEINATGYGLTFGLHTRIDSRVQEIVDRVHAGNIYVNRNQIGAVVGSQPFGGEGLSGTGPKAGGPYYLGRFRRPAPAAPSAPAVWAQPRADVNGIQAALRQLSATDPVPREAMLATLRAALRGRAADAMRAVAALDTGPVDLPGPTGEINALWLPPLGTVMCTGPWPRALLEQAAQALGCGNRVLAVAPEARKVLKALREAELPVACVDGLLRPKDLHELVQIGAVAMAADTPQASEIRQAQAARKGAIAKLILTPAGPEAFCHERAVCIDTTAAGGNAALLAAQS
ncbi:MAG: L-glutamate gamma-semialdehyde dehydrogenase, partial [Paracoccaceae bacterium]